MYCQINSENKNDPTEYSREDVCIACSKVSSNKLLHEHSAAAILGLKVKTLQNWRVSGIGPRFVRHSRRAVRYRYRDLIDWIESRVVSSTSEAT